MSLYNYFKVLPSKEVDTPSRLVVSSLRNFVTSRTELTFAQNQRGKTSENCLVLQEPERREREREEEKV